MTGRDAARILVAGVAGSDHSARMMLTAPEAEERYIAILTAQKSVLKGLAEATLASVRPSVSSHG